VILIFLVGKMTGMGAWYGRAVVTRDDPQSDDTPARGTFAAARPGWLDRMAKVRNAFLTALGGERA
jgi:hypothetical protein